MDTQAYCVGPATIKGPQATATIRYSGPDLRKVPEIGSLARPWSVGANV